METLLNGKSENYLQKMLYEPIIHNTAEFQGMWLHCPVCAPVGTTSAIMTVQLPRPVSGRSEDTSQCLKGTHKPHKLSFSEHFLKHHVECTLVLLICKCKNYERNVRQTTAVLKRTAPHPKSTGVLFPWVMKNTIYSITTSDSCDLPDPSAISNTTFFWIDGIAFARS